MIHRCIIAFRLLVGIYQDKRTRWRRGLGYHDTSAKHRISKNQVRGVMVMVPACEHTIILLLPLSTLTKESRANHHHQKKKKLRSRYKVQHTYTNKNLCSLVEESNAQHTKQFCVKKKIHHGLCASITAHGMTSYSPRTSAWNCAEMRERSS